MAFDLFNDLALVDSQAAVFQLGLVLISEHCTKMWNTTDMNAAELCVDVVVPIVKVFHESDLELSD